ncbi:hypothetical protein BCR35DRAFT_313089 [Leucosporidium creatinivorum]|uniref:F-box domain-containing protein n=1 Tax=Leucosporidium creatinivorum TaxID=106004 RepID=A0A1Y2FVQ0_9BASI|nr:hypothetical protein BCR35DRAFT_313089 [Leucosporidium creatinivorum]
MTTTPPLPISIFSPTLPQTPPPLSAVPSTPMSVSPDVRGDRSPPPSPTPASTSAGPSSVLPLSSIRMRAISPPTPAPSPQPFHHSNRFPPPADAQWSSPPQAGEGASEEELVQAMRAQFGNMSSSMRLRLLSLLIADSPPSSLSPLLPLITPRLKRDFLKTLPLELAFHVLSFVDDVRTLARASGVSRFWRALLEDEATWRRMCWKSGFGDADAGEVVGSPVTAGQRLKTLEFGEREEEEGTPAGRERRGTLDRSSLLEFAARAEFFGLRSDAPVDSWQVPAQLPGVSAAEVQGIHGSVGSTGLGLGSTLTTVQSTLAERRARSSRARSQGQDDASASQPLPFHQTHAATTPAHLNLDPSPESARPTFAAPTLTSGPMASTSAAVHPPLQALVSPPLHSLSMSLPSSHVLRSPSRSQPITTVNSPSHSSAKKPFSYKTHFKRAYLTESAWLRGPGRLLSTQMSADDGVVTSMGFDNEWIVVGMATSKVHIFEAGTGSYVKTLDGHELGVWCLTLVSKNGGAKDDSKGKARAADEWSDTFASRFGQPSPMGATFSQPGSRARSGDTSFTNDSPNAGSAFFRHAQEEPTTSSTDPHTSPPRRRRSFQGFGSTSPTSSSSSSAPRTGGMGLGAGGETGDSSQQAGVCGTARGWGQKGAVVVSGGCDRDVRVWDVESGTCKHVLRGHSSTVRCMRVIDGRPIAVSGSRDATLRVWNIETGTAMHQLVGHSHSVRCIEVSGNKVVSGSYDATCRLWDVDTGECLFVYRGHIHQIYAVAFDGIRVVTGSLDSTVRIWSATTGEFLALLQGHTSLVGQLQLDPISNVLVTGGSDGRVIVFSLSTFDTIHRLCAHDNSVTCLQFDDRFIVTGGNDGRIKLWDFKTGVFIRELAEPCDAVWRVTFRDDKHVVLCRREGKTLMDVRTFRPSETDLG